MQSGLISLSKHFIILKPKTRFSAAARQLHGVLTDISLNKQGLEVQTRSPDFLLVAKKYSVEDCMQILLK